MKKRKPKMDEWIKNIRVWDNGGVTFDRYTIAIPYKGDIHYYGMGSDVSPQGYNSYIGVDLREGDHLGKKIDIEDLPEDILFAIEKRYETLINISFV